MPTPTALTLFSGVGASSKALRDLGLNVLAHEVAPAAVASLTRNGFPVRAGDVRGVDFRQHRGRVRAIVGGPPCQPFSQAHSGAGRYDERDMIPEFIRAIDEARPEVFVMEEVQTLTWKKHRDYLNMVLGDLRALGYVVDWRVLNAADYGIPQARKRLFVVGSRVGEVQWPDRVEDVATLAEALGWDAATCVARNAAVPDPRAHDADRAQWPLHRPGMTVVGSFRPEVMAAPGYRKAGDPPRQATPGSVVLTLAERKALQDLPPDWVIEGTPAEQDLQVGNSCPVGLIRQIVEANLHD